MTAPLGMSPLIVPTTPLVTLASEQSTNNPTCTIRAIISYCATHFGLTDIQITGESRRLLLIEPRHISMYLAVLLTGRSSTVIGRCFHRDHTSILYARDKVEAHMLEDSHFAAEVTALRASILAQTIPNQAPFNE